MLSVYFKHGFMYLLVEVFPFDICRSELLESEIIVAELLAVSSFF